ncbi:MAG TPA: ABC-2 family transporter protein [Actinocrinis sp.]|jgi:ABC-2 type transport system permease protein
MSAYLLDSAAPAQRPARSAWRAGRISALGELLSPGRLVGTAVRLAIQIALVVFLWRALYAHTSSNAGLTRDQAVDYAVLAVLATRVRGLDRDASRDSIFAHVYMGTIVYWFLRPVPPRRYYLYRALGEQAYGLTWFALGYVACRIAGVLGPPASAANAMAFVAALLLGQAVYHELTLSLDLMCFWTLRNGSALTILQFVQNLLSGGYAPLWYFPGWFIAMSGVLPFQATLNVPLSLYTGRIALSAAPAQLAIQAGWVAGLCLVNRRLWRRAGDRVTSQGG